MIQKVPRWAWFTLLSIAGALLVTGIVFLVPHGKNNQTKAGPTAVAPSVPAPPKASCAATTNCVARIPLPANGSKSTAVDIDAVVPETWNYSFSGPPGTVACWESDGQCAPINLAFDLGNGRRGWGTRDGLVQFSAPAGAEGEVIVQSHPPR